MKTLMKIAVIFAAVIAFNACKSGGGNPEDVAKKFLDHLNKKEYAEAKKLGTENTVQFISMIESFGGAMDGEEEKEVKVENMKCEVDGDKAHCTFTSDGKEDKLDLVKQEGKWLVDMKKEDPMGGEMDEVEDAVDDVIDTAAEMIEEEMEEVE